MQLKCAVHRVIKNSFVHRMCQLVKLFFHSFLAHSQQHYYVKQTLRNEVVEMSYLCVIKLRLYIDDVGGKNILNIKPSDLPPYFYLIDSGTLRARLTGRY